MSDSDIVKRNVIETVTEEELDQLLANKSASVYCGYETSGRVHIGHMVTATKLLDLQNAGLTVKILFADVHTGLNRKGAGDWIEKMVDYWRHCFVALGLDKAEYVSGSDFQFKKEYIEDVLKLAQDTTMNRALRSMQEVARDIENAHVSQVIYPLMQIVDIKALGVDIAYGGLEQRKIHMLARELLPSIGYKKPVCLHTPLICSLKGPECKMSSSKPETIIAVDEDSKSIKAKVKAAYCPPEAENNPVLDACRLIVMPKTGCLKVVRPEKYGGNVEYTRFEELKNDYITKKLHPADLKASVANSLSEVLESVRDYMSENKVEFP
ncbi:MAG: tyrosine--tRNA ligase [Candidatus Altiarchaeota archaeon]|nr:tyrosine--tRNA ligase [Candidatus Altiarchaeota archaeon]